MERDMQQVAIERINNGENLFLTGKAGCVDKDTEFLSEDGWHKISDYSKGQKVAQIHQEDNLRMSFCEPLGYVKEPCNEFIQITGDRVVEQKLSKDHNVAYTVKDKAKLNKKTILQVIESFNNNVSGFFGKIPCTFNYSPLSEPFFKSEDDIRLAVALKADGSFTCENTFRYVIRLKKENKVKRFTNILDRMGKKYKVRVGPDGYSQFSLYHQGCTKKLDQFWMCDYKTAKIIFDEIPFWDGSLDKRTKLPLFFTTLKSDADTCQYIFSIMGFKSNIDTKDRRGRIRKLNGVEYITKSIDYVVNCSTQTHIGLLNVKSEEGGSNYEVIKETGSYKYCFEVPTGFLLLRKKDKIFVTGNSGKSYVLDCITNSRTIKCATTGTAAINIGAITAHSLFGLPLTLPTKEDHYTVSKKMRKLIQEGQVNRIILDEGSMLRADMLDVIDKKLKTLKKNTLPFGGIQMIITGDFYQLEPIVHFTEEDIYYDRYDSAFCFNAKAWDFPAIELTKSYRNVEENQIRVLDSIRTKDKNHRKALDWIKRNAKTYSTKDNNLHLCCFNRDANALNSIQYRIIKEKEFKYISEDEGSYTGDKPVKEVLSLKEGCRVLIKSNCSNGSYVNGDRGEVYSLTQQLIRVKLDRTGKDVVVTKARWDQNEYKVTAKGLEVQLKGTYIQYPITLGYATSIHSSQGSTLDNVALDFGTGAFAHGMAYVAFSRCRDLRNISLVEDVSYESLICDPLVSKFYDSIERS